MRLLWLPEVLRGAGLAVDTYDGWAERGSATYGPIAGVIAHATAGSPTSTDAGEMRVLWVTGSTSAPAPIAQCYLSRSGRWTVGASGRCNHVKLSDVKASSPLGVVGNTNLIGVEAQNDNRGQPWPAVQIDSYQRGVAAILRRLGMGATRVLGHWEHQAGKSDPYGLSMVAFRLAVGRHLTPAPPQEAQMRLFGFAGQHWQSPGPSGRYRVEDVADWNDLVRVWGTAAIYPGVKTIGGEFWPTCALDEVLPGSNPPKRPDGGNPWTAADVDKRFGPPASSATPGAGLGWPDLSRVSIAPLPPAA